MTVYYTNEKAMAALSEADRKELDERIISSVDMWKGEGLDLANLRYVDQVRYKGMTFFIEVSDAEAFLFEDDEDESFLGFAEDTVIEAKRIG